MTRRGDLSRYVERAVAREVLLETVAELHERNAHIPHEELMELIDGELAEVRRLRRGPA